MLESVITTKNIKESIAERVKSTPFHDFELAQYSTYIFDSNSGSYNEDIADKNISDELFLHHDMRIGQEYTIIFREFETQEELPKNILDVKLNATKNMCEVYADIALTRDDIQDQEEIYSSIVGEINRKKALYGVLIGIFDECMFETMTVKVEELMKRGVARMLVSKSRFKPKDTQKFEIQRVFLQNRLNINSKYIQTSPGNVLLKVTPHVTGYGGRSCFGRYLYFQDYEQGEIPTISYNSERIDVNEAPDGKLMYIAKKSGLVDFENFVIDIKDSVVLNKISQAQTGDIELDTVTVYVKAQDELDDSVEDGTTVESDKLDVDTMVGANSKVKSTDVTIRASTHNTSKIEAEKANIKIHKGHLKAVTAEIGTLEHGFVEARDATVDNILGGVVRADTIHIKNIQASFADILAYKRITVDNVVGEGNIFRIKYGFNQEEIASMEDVKKRLEFTNNDLTKINTSINKNKKFFQVHKSRIDEIAGMSLNKMTLAQHKVAQAAVATKKLITELELKKSEIVNHRDALQSQVDKFTNDIFMSEVVIKSCAPGNIIEFVVFREKNDYPVRYVTTQNDQGVIYKLDEHLRIQKTKI